MVSVWGLERMRDATTTPVTKSPITAIGGRHDIDANREPEGQAEECAGEEFKCIVLITAEHRREPPFFPVRRFSWLAPQHEVAQSLKAWG